MTATNRILNRTVLLLTGLVLVAGGVVAGLLAWWPTFTAGWRSTAPQVAANVPAWATKPTVGTVGWAAIIVAAVALVLAVLLIVFVVRRGHGRTGTVVERREEHGGRTVVDLGVARGLLTEHLDSDPDLVANHVVAYRVRGVPTLSIRVRARRGVSPAKVAQDVVGALHALDAVLGTELPAAIRISGGFRVRASAARARVA